jgi:hypothetical protein
MTAPLETRALKPPCLTSTSAPPGGTQTQSAPDPTRTSTAPPSVGASTLWDASVSARTRLSPSSRCSTARTPFGASTSSGLTGSLSQTTAAA